MSEALSYPIGRWSAPDPMTDALRLDSMARIGSLPSRLREAVQGLDHAQLATPYRPGGWTVQQVVHHVADSHLNAWIRVRLALTEEFPRITAYNQDAWARLPDSGEVPIEASLRLLEGLHARWVALLGQLAPAQWQREYDHPENGRQRLDLVTHHYAWHGDHHLAHVAGLRRREGW